MNKFFRISLTLTALCSLLTFNACNEDPPLPDNIVQFETDALGFSPTDSELPINFVLTRDTEVAGTITLSMELITDAAYGTDFTTEPASTDGTTIAVPVAAGVSTVTVKLKKVENALYDGDEKVTFHILSVSDNFVIGVKTTLDVSFSEIISTSGTLEVNGGGPTFPNKVFIDLSANRQTAVERTHWDLAFSNTANVVLLNSSNGMMARALDKTDMAAVTAADTVGFGGQLSFAAVFAALNLEETPDWVTSAIEWIDDPAGDLSKTAISTPGSASESKVYIVNRGTGAGAPPAPELGWKKVKVIRNGDGYTLQVADIGSPTITEFAVPKNPNYDYQYVHFTNGVVMVEPESTKWDLAWTGFGNSTNFGFFVPYYFQDIVLQHSSVQTAKVLTSAVSYEAFAEANLAGLVYSSSQLGIGSDWRSGGGPGTSPSNRTDRFYVVKDAEGNYYKLRFTALTTNGERGKPQIEFALVKKAG